MFLACTNHSVLCPRWLHQYFLERLELDFEWLSPLWVMWAYLIIVADAADAVSVNFSGRCKFLQI